LEIPTISSNDDFQTQVKSIKASVYKNVDSLGWKCGKGEVFSNDKLCRRKIYIKFILLPVSQAGSKFILSGMVHLSVISLLRLFALLDTEEV